jgi:AraC-like DNA-binding protein
MQAPYISASFLRGFNRLVLSKGGNPARLYEPVGLEKSAMANDAVGLDRLTNLLIPFDKFVYLLENAARALQFPDIARQLARQQDMMILAPLIPQLKDSSNIQQALDIILKYLRILVSGYQVEVKAEQSHVTLTFSLVLPHIQALVQYQDYAMASAVSIIHGLLGKAYPIRGCFFLRSEQNTQVIADYARYFGCPVAFGCHSLSLTADKSILTQDTQRLVGELNSRVSNTLALGKIHIVELVSEVISFSLANGSGNIEDTATAMHLSPRTLQRRLQAEGVTYRALLDAVRLNMANQYLNNTYYRLTDIAAFLGYANLSAFSRSYQRWTGVAPSVVRQQIPARA